jgi:hypothetical protein
MHDPSNKTRGEFGAIFVLFGSTGNLRIQRYQFKGWIKATHQQRTVDGEIGHFA